VRSSLIVQLLVWPSLALAQPGSPAGPVPPANLVTRRAALMERMGTGIAILRGNSERSIDPPDAEYPQDTDFRQDNDFFYLTGLEVPDAVLLLITQEDGPDQVQLFLPARDANQERWLGARMGPGPEAAAAAGLPENAVRPFSDYERVLDSLLSGSSSNGPGRLFTRKNQRDPRLPEIQRVSGRMGRTEDLLPHLAALRLIKDPDEQARLRRAVEISAEGHLAAMRTAKPGAWEYELEAAAEFEFRRRGAERLGYPSIVGAGMNSTVLHYDESRARLEDGDLIVMDMGAEFGYYSADLTRTVPASGRFSNRQRAIYDLVLAAQQAAIDAIRPGVTMAQLEAIARRVLRDGSRNLCGSRTCDTFMIHGLGHYIGMDVHDVGSYQVPLAAGVALTIEPGIYLPGEGLGVRIEDDILVTANGHELLSSNLPRKAEEIEAIMRGN
jgi:Xaa-Pro aminopeptidase